MAFVIKRHDLRPRYRVQLTSSEASTGVQVPVDLTDATSVRFIMTGTKATTPKVDSSGDFVDRANGVVEYHWSAGDTDTAGDYYVEIEISWSGEPQTFPSVGFFKCKIVSDLA
jgi:hypothetical protein